MSFPMAYVCGGEYFNPSINAFEFRLVRPTSSESPYVALLGYAASLFNLCKHHSHLYEVNVNSGRATLLQTGEVDSENRIGVDASYVRAPKVVTLSVENIRDIMRVIQSGNTWAI